MIKCLYFVMLLALVGCIQKRDRKNQVNNKKIDLKVIDSNKTYKVISIIDGDTYDILTDKKNTIRVRMEGIDAPEKGMPFYKAAKHYLVNLCFNKYVRLEIHDTDSRGRKIAYSFLEDGTELSHEMLRAGYAWHFVKYNKDKDLQKLEKDARISKIGLWAEDSPMPPWENRRLHKNGISTKDSFNLNKK